MSLPLGMGGIIVGTIVGLLIGIAALLIRIKLNARNMPAGEKKTGGPGVHLGDEGARPVL